MYEEKQEKKKKNRFFKESSNQKEITLPVLKSKEKKKEVKKEKAEKEKQKDKKRLSKENREKEFLGIKADWIAILIKLGFLLIIAFLIIFISTKIKNKGNSFEENINKIKDAAYTYYKVENHRPILLDEEVVMTLENMEKGSLVPELKDKKNNICSKEYSYVSLTKRSNIDYEMNIYLTCGGESKGAFYEIQYENETEVQEKVTLYEMKRTIPTASEYICPEGYIVSGRYCIKNSSTTIINGIPKYKVTPEINKPAIYKSGNTNYEYKDPIKSIEITNKSCPNGYILKGEKCEKEGKVIYKQENTYTCSNGILSGTACIEKKEATYKEEIPYCKNGTMNQGKCYITENYSVKCIHGDKDASLNRCYITYNSNKELSDWLLDQYVVYNENKTLYETERTRYEIDEYLENGKIRYKKYIRVYKKTCKDNDTLSGSTCRHYDEAYEEKYCRNGYYYDKEKNTCYKIEEPSMKKITPTYTCEDGYILKGTGANKYCYKQEKAIKTTKKIPICASSKYTLTSDNKCIETKEPYILEEKEYTCPEGYTKIGKKENTKCYKKTKENNYYYCSSNEATLIEDRCVIEEKREFISYSCPKGYKVSGNQCIKENVKETILATKTEENNLKEEKIWSKTKDLKGWTWTGNMKQE